jgi:hypothetical protein
MTRAKTRGPARWTAAVGFGGALTKTILYSEILAVQCTIQIFHCDNRDCTLQNIVSKILKHHG